MAAHDTYQWRSPVHFCSDNCPWLYLGDLCVCQQSGNFHYCTNATCDRKQATREALVCSLTGMSYDLDFVYDEYGTEHCMDRQGADHMAADDDAEDMHDFYAGDDMEAEAVHMDDDTPVVPATLKRRKKAAASGTVSINHTDEVQCSPTVPLQHALHHLDLSGPTSSSSGTEDGPPSKSSKKQQDRQAVWYTMLRKLFASRAGSQQLALFECIIRATEQLWSVIHDGPADKQPTRYHAEYHLLCVLHLSCNGYTCMGIEVIPLLPFVKQSFPPISSLKDVKLPQKVKPHIFTQTCKAFRERIRCTVASKSRYKVQQVLWS